MKVLLVRSRPTVVENTRLPSSLSDEVGYVMPLGIASIASSLIAKGIETGILDAEAEELSLERVKSRIAEFNPSIVGITCMTPTIHDDMDIAKIAKELGAKVVVGGPQVSAMPEETARLPYVDFAIQGEGETPMLKLLEAIEGDGALSDVPGLIYQNETGTICSSPPFIEPDLDTLPYPAIGLLPYERYGSIISNGRLASVCPGRGCPFKCGFCFKQPSDRKIRFRTPESVVDEIELIMDKYGINEINFVSDTLTIKKDFMFGFCEEIIRRNIKISWIAPTRADCVSLDMLKLMKRAGCRSLRFGVESGSPEILKLIDKSCKIEKIVDAFNWAKEANISTFAYFIIGYIHETEETVRQTINFARKIKPDLLMYNLATPLPNTPLFHQAIEAGLVDKDYWKRFIKDRDTPRIPYLFEDADKWIGIAYRKFFFRPKFLLKRVAAIRPGTIVAHVKAMRGLIGLR